MVHNYKTRVTFHIIFGEQLSEQNQLANAKAKELG
jgi:hypothetical protein